MRFLSDVIIIVGAWCAIIWIGSQVHEYLKPRVQGTGLQWVTTVVFTLIIWVLVLLILKDVLGLRF